MVVVGVLLGVTPLEQIAAREAAGDDGGALAVAESWAATEPGSPYGHLEAARLGLKLGRSLETVDWHLRWAYALAPDNPRGLHLWGLLEEERGDLEGARGAQRKALALRSDYLDAHRKLAALAERASDWAEAEKELKYLIRAGDGDTGLKLQLARVQERSGQDRPGGGDAGRPPQGGAEERGGDPGPGRPLRPQRPPAAVGGAHEIARAPEARHALAERIPTLSTAAGAVRCRARCGSGPGWTSGRRSSSVRYGGSGWGPSSTPRAWTAGFRHLADLLSAAPGVTLAALFGPEHGVRGEVQYMEAVGEASGPADRRADALALRQQRRVAASPPRVARGARRRRLRHPGRRARATTPTSTPWPWRWRPARRARRAGSWCSTARTRSAGERVEGNLVEPGFESFVGLLPAPEPPRDDARRAGADAQRRASASAATSRSCPCLGWSRRMGWAETGLPFVPPSPNMPTPDTALVYPGMCLLEGTNLSEGRGTCRPFEQFGAPYLDAQRHRRGRSSATRSLGSGSVRCTSCPPGTSTTAWGAPARSCT